MYKQIPSSNISTRSFKVYKQWTLSQSDVAVLTATAESGSFDVDTFTTTGGYYIHPLYNSIKSKYYQSNGNVMTQFGVVRNPGEFTTSRTYSDTIQVISIPQLQYGEQMKKGTIELTDLDNVVSYVDDSWGNIVGVDPTYYFISYDAETAIMLFTDGSTQYTATVSYFDVNTGIAIFTLFGITDTYYVVRIDFQTNELTTTVDLLFEGLDLQAIPNGNVFYDEGLIVLTSEVPFNNYSLSYKSTQTIYEMEVLITANKGEFNYSQNPSAVTVTTGSAEYDFAVTGITNTKPAGLVRIKDIANITQKTAYYGTFNSGSSELATGSWDDYAVSASVDPTGSYLTTYITTIGLYDASGSMVGVAKLPQAIKKLPDHNVNFIVRLDL